MRGCTSAVRLHNPQGLLLSGFSILCEQKCQRKSVRDTRENGSCSHAALPSVVFAGGWGPPRVSQLCGPLRHPLLQQLSPGGLRGPRLTVASSKHRTDVRPLLSHGAEQRLCVRLLLGRGDPGWTWGPGPLSRGVLVLVLPPQSTPAHWLVRAAPLSTPVEASPLRPQRPGSVESAQLTAQAGPCPPWPYASLLPIRAPQPCPQPPAPALAAPCCAEGPEGACGPPLPGAGAAPPRAAEPGRAGPPAV